MNMQIAQIGRTLPDRSFTARTSRYVTKRPALKRALAGLARDLRSPMASLSLIVELIEADERALRMEAGRGGPDGSGMLPEALSCQIITLLDDLRATGNPFALRPGLADLSVVIQRALSARRPVAEARGLTMTAEALAPLVVDGDGRLLVKAVGDLLDLVMAHSAAGAKLACVVQLLNHEASITLSTDSARDLRHQLAAALHPFRGASRSITRLEPWLARHVIEHHGGRVSCMGEGSHCAGLQVHLPARFA